MEICKCISFKANSSIYQLCDSDSGDLYRQKVISRLTPTQLLRYSEILNENSNSGSELSRRLSFDRVEVNQERQELIILSQYINCQSSVQLLKELGVSCKKIELQRIAKLGFELLDQLINDGHRSFLPTCENIYISIGEVILNGISFVGLRMIEFKESLPRSEFMEISAILTGKMFENDQQTERGNFVTIKQKAVVIFMLSLLFNKQITFIYPKDMNETVSPNEVISLLKLQRTRIKKYFSNKKILSSLKQFESQTNLRLTNLIYILFIDEESISWSRFFNQLLIPDLCTSQLKEQFHCLAEFHWLMKSEYERRVLIANKHVSLRSITQKFKRSDSDFFLMRLTKTHFSILLQYNSFYRIINESAQFDMLNYNIWSSFLKILPLGYQGNMMKQMLSMKDTKGKELRQSNSFNVTQSPKNEDEEEFSPQSDNQSLYPNELTQQSLLFLTKKEINIKFLLQFSSKKLTNHLDLNQKKINIEHQKLKIMNQYESAFR